MHRGKTSGPFSVPTHILKDFGELLVDPLECIINKSLREGIFPALLKSARVLSAQFTKKVINKIVEITGQYRCSLIWVKFLREYFLINSNTF